MKEYTVIYVRECDGIQWQFFNCMADDAEHAEEQCINFSPDCCVLWVNEGHNNTTMD